MAHAGFPNGIGCTEQDILEKLLADTDLNRRLILDIDGVPIGEMNYRSIADGTAEIGIKICDYNEQDKGFGTVFLTMLINFLFENMGYHTIVLDTNAKNSRAQHVYENIGFRKVALHLNAWRNQLGEWQSSIDYELTRAEFRTKKEEMETSPSLLFHTIRTLYIARSVRAAIICRYVSFSFTNHLQCWSRLLLRPHGIQHLCKYWSWLCTR